MKKNEFRGLTRSTFPKDVLQMFQTHLKLIGEASYTWVDLFKHLVMDNNRFPNDVDVEEVCSAYFTALHSGEIDRGMGLYAQTIEAHVKSFGKWFPDWNRHRVLRRAPDLLYGKPEPPKVQVDTEAPVTRHNWNLTNTKEPIGRIREVVRIYDELMKAKNAKGFKGTELNLHRFRESIRRYEIAFANTND
jgi:hypothetical protein